MAQATKGPARPRTSMAAAAAGVVGNFAAAGRMCVIEGGWRVPKSGLAPARKSSHNPTIQIAPQRDKPKLWPGAKGSSCMSATPPPSKKSVCVPSRTSRSYACQYHRTCRSSLSLSVSRGDPAIDRGGRLTSGGRRLARVDVADDDDVDMRLLLTVGVVSK